MTQWWQYAIGLVAFLIGLYMAVKPKIKNRFIELGI